MEKWLRQYQGQMVITAGQISWTEHCEKALHESSRALKALRKKWITYLTKLTGITRSDLSKVERLKVVALMTIEVHARDVIEKLYRANCTSPLDFEWVSRPPSAIH